LAAYILSSQMRMRRQSGRRLHRPVTIEGSFFSLSLVILA
jgi:hypothetical protein